MFLKSLSLQNFRNYKKRKFQFSPETTLIIGPNASGKTNILEAIYLLSRGRSFRAKIEKEMIDYQSQLANLNSQIIQDNNEIKLEIVLTKGEVQGKRVAKKLYRINGVGRRMVDFVGSLKCVLFRPEDIELVLGSPSIRREYLDATLELVDLNYRVCNLAYQKGLRQRNKLLVKIREGEARASQLEFWNRLLIKNGEIISQKREELVGFFNDAIKEGDLSLEYDKSPISPERLAKYSQAEIAIGATLVGPHRDDLKFKSKNLKGNTVKRDLALFGSRGEQRMAVLSLKLSELSFIEEKTVQKPVLLLDDIFSELDKDHRKQVLSIINKQQAILTTTEVDLVEKRYLGKMKIEKL